MPHRTFTDSLHRQWQVWTVTPTKVERRNLAKPAIPPDEERRVKTEYRVLLGRQWVNGWLAFETRGEKRRLAAYPEDWQSLTDAELERLCERAKPVKPSRRLVE